MKSCLICKQNVEAFLPYKNGLASFSALTRALNIVGSDVENFHCPHCRSTDRERHLFIYLSFVPELLAGLAGARILHFAPETYLSALIVNQKPLEYIKADLHSRSADVQTINLQEIGYPDGYFDVVIANHVLEHVNDDRLAIAEVARVLRPGGHAILQTPYSAILPSSVTEFTAPSETTRELLFGQSDHARLYGLDVFSRIEQSGLRFIGGHHAQLDIAIDSALYGVNKEEPFFLFQK